MAKQHAAALTLGGLMTASAVLLLAVRSNLEFMLDDWAFVIYRADGNLGDILEPHNDHISILPVSIYKLLLSVFGMSSAMPFHVVSVAAFMAVVLAVFLYLRPMVGDPAAVIACAVILFLGSAWEDLLWAFQMGFFLSLAGGVGALVMLRRDDHKGDVLACLMLCVSITSSSLGLAFLPAAAIWLLVRQDRRLGRLWVIAVPALIYAAWWIGWGHEATSTISTSNALGIPSYLFSSFQYSFAVINGTFRIEPGFGDTLTRIIGAVVLVSLGAYLYVKRKLSRSLLVALALALAFWGLTALNLHPGREFDTSRYLLPGAIFLIMILAGVFEGVRPGRRTLMVLAAVAAVAIVCNLFALRDGYERSFKPLSDKGIAGITAVDLAQGPVEPGLAIGMNSNDTAKVLAGSLIAAEGRYGDSPAWDADEIEEASATARAVIDQYLISVLPISTRPASIDDARHCRSVKATPGGKPSYPVPGRFFVVKSEKRVVILLGRFGEGAGALAGFGDPGEAQRMGIPADRSTAPWRVAFKGGGRVLLCESRPG